MRSIQTWMRILAEQRQGVYGMGYVRVIIKPLCAATCLREALRRRQGTPLADFFNLLRVC